MIEYDNSVILAALMIRTSKAHPTFAFTNEELAQASKRVLRTYVNEEGTTLIELCPPGEGR